MADSTQMKRLLMLSNEISDEEPVSGGATIAELMEATAEITVNIVPDKDILIRFSQK